MAARFCAQCGNAVAEDAKFCDGCGAPLPESAPAPSTTPAISVSKADASSGADQGAPPAPAQGGGLTSVLAKLMPLFTNPVAFVILYLVAIIPSYLLPYVGSNSSVINATGAALGIGFTVFFWMHVTTLYLAGIIAWFRGLSIGKSWLPIFPFLAAVFDLSPGFSWIPLLPTLFHVLALVLGVIGESKQYRFKMYQMAGAAAGLVLGVSLVLIQAAAYERSAQEVVQQFGNGFETQVGQDAIAKHVKKPTTSSTATKFSLVEYIEGCAPMHDPEHCSFDEFQRLIRSGANVNEGVGMSNKDSPLSMVLIKNLDLRYMEALVNSGAAVTGQGIAPIGDLVSASDFGSLESREKFKRKMDVLIKSGANIDAVNSRGLTAIMIAARGDTPMLVEALFKAGANPHLKNKKAGQSAYESVRDKLAYYSKALPSGTKPWYTENQERGKKEYERLASILASTK